MAVLGLAGAPTDAAARVQKVHSGAGPRIALAHASSGDNGTKRVRIGGHGRKEASRERYYSYGGGLQCVPFARENSGIELAGNASAWWNAADGVYERGARPEVGSVLNFRANGRMRSGHVAVVSKVINPRMVEIDHANWSGRGSVTRNVAVVDVSERNDWSAVRVALSRDDEFGSVYPTYGFIYDRPDRGVMVANNATAPIPAALNAPPRDLRPSFGFDLPHFSLVGGASAAEAEPVEVAEATTRSSYRRRGHASLVHRTKSTAHAGRHRRSF